MGSGAGGAATGKFAIYTLICVWKQYFQPLN